MRITRRSVLGMGGGIVTTLSLPGMARAQETIEIAMAGTRDGSRVWFDPVGLRIEIGQAVQSTATAIRPRLIIQTSPSARSASRRTRSPGIPAICCRTTHFR